MPIIKSAKKRVRASSARAKVNQLRRVGAKTAARTAVRPIAANQPAAADAVRQAASRLDRAAAKGAIHKNKASRLKSRLALKLKASATNEVKKAAKTKKTTKSK